MKNFIAVLVLSVFTTASFAQVSVGFKVGHNTSSVKVEGVGDVLSPKTIGNYNIGAVAEIRVAPGFAFQPELNFKRKGFKVKEGIDVNLLNIPIPLGAEAITEIKYVEMPLMGKYKFGKDGIGGYVMAGPYVGYAHQATLRTKANVLIDFNLTNTELDLTNDNYNRLDAGAIGGVGFWASAGQGQFFADARIQHSMNDMFNDPLVDVQMQNKGFEFNAGYMYRF